MVGASSQASNALPVGRKHEQRAANYRSEMHISRELLATRTDDHVNLSPCGPVLSGPPLLQLPGGRASSLRRNNMTSLTHRIASRNTSVVRCRHG